MSEKIVAVLRDVPVYPEGSMTRPMKRIVPDSASWIKKINGWSALKLGGGESALPMGVAADASVSSSFTLMTAV